jgi:hypothetical protein
MRIEYKFTFADSVLFQAVHQFLSPQVQLIYGAMFAVIFFAEARDTPVSQALATAGAIWLVMWVLQFACNALILVSRKNHSVLTTHRIEIQETGLVEETKFNKSLFYWPGIVKVVSRPGYIAIYVSSQQAHVIPKRAFSSQSEAEQFKTAVLERMQLARGHA